MSEKLCSHLHSYVPYNSAMLDKSSTMSIMSDQSSHICACPSYMCQYHIPKFPIKSLDACTPTYSETF